MPSQLVFYPIPYRDTAKREAVINSAINDVANEYQKKLATNTYAIRPLFFNDLLAANASSSVVTESGIVLGSVTASSSTFNYTASATITITTPQNKVYGIYGFADYSAQPAARLVTVSIAGTTYNPIYLAPAILTDEDHVFVLNGKFRPIPPNTTAQITIYGTAAQTENFDILGFVAETPPSVSE